MDAGDAFAPVARLDAPAVLAAVEREHGLRLRDAGRCPGGNVGAAYVSLPDGRDGVLTWQGGSGRERHDEVGRLTAVARSCGVPAPAYLHVLPVDTPAGRGVAVVQERLPGTPPERVGAGLVMQVRDLSGRLRGALHARPEIPAAELHLRSSGPGYCVHETLAAHSPRTRRLLDAVRAAGSEVPPTVPGDDLVHLDLQPANVLVDADGRVTGVIDWDGAARGDARLDLVVLLFGLHAYATPPTLIDDLHRDVRDELDPPSYAAYWASLALRQVDWAIRHFGEEDVRHWLDVADALAP